MDKGMKIIKGKIVILIRNLLDIFVANYYLHKPQGQAAKIGVIGTITSIIGILQALKMI
jgi:hypothetical protein